MSSSNNVEWDLASSIEGWMGSYLESFSTFAFTLPFDVSVNPLANNFQIIDNDPSKNNSWDLDSYQSLIKNR